MIFLLLLLPTLQNVVGFNFYVAISKPYNSQTFDYYDTYEVFSGGISATGLVPYEYYKIGWEWYIDSVLKDDGSPIERASASGTIAEYYLIDVNPTDYSSGSHTAYFIASISYKSGEFWIVMDSKSDTHTWYRDTPPPTYIPTVTFTTPLYDNTYYNYTANGIIFTPVWNLGDVDDNVDVMRLYLDGALQTTWNNPPETVNPPYDSYSYGVTIDTEKTYTLVVNGTDDDSNFFEESIHVIGISTGGSISVTDPTSYYLGDNPTFQITTTDVNGLNNLTIYCDVTDSFYRNESTTVTNMNCNLTNSESISVDQGYSAFDYDMDYSQVDIWNDDYQLDDDGSNTANWYTSSEGWDWTQSYGVSGGRANGYLTIYDTVANSYGGVQTSRTNTYGYSTYGSQRTYYEFCFTANQTEAKYDYIDFMIFIKAGYYAHILLYANDTAVVGVANGLEFGTWYVNEKDSFNFVQNQKYYFRFTVGTSWLAYQISTGSGFTTFRNSTSDYTNYFTYALNLYANVKNAAGQTNAYLNIDYFRSGRAEWQTSDTTSCGLTDSSSITLPGDSGEDFDVDFVATSCCRFWGTITTILYYDDFTYYVYNTSAATTQTNSQLVSTVHWDLISEGIFYLNFTIYNDLGIKSSILLEKYKDTTAPSLQVTMPYNSSEWFVSEVPSLNYFVNWSENEGCANTLRFELNYNSSNKIDITWNLLNQIPDRFPACDRKIVDSFGEYYFRITATDSAGNRNVSSIIWFFVYNERNVAISCTSIYDSNSISQDYLLFFIDGIQYEYDNLLVRTEKYHLEIRDVFMNSLYDNTVEIYDPVVSIDVPLRRVNFTNPNTAGCEYKIWQGIYSRAFIISTTINVSYYLFDGNYTLVANAIDPHYQDNIQYIATSTTFQVFAGMETISISLNTFAIEEFKMFFICRSSYNLELIDIETYLRIYVNDTFIDGYCAYVYSKSLFEVRITDVFGNELYNSIIPYGILVTIQVDLRLCTFTNKEQQATSIVITQSGGTGELFFPMPMGGSRAVYLFDGSYTIEHKPSSPDKGEGEMYTSKSYSFDCSLASQQLDLWLGVFENVPPQFNFLANLQEYMLMLRNIILTSLGFQVGILFAAIFVLFMIAKRIPKID